MGDITWLWYGMRGMCSMSSSSGCDREVAALKCIFPLVGSCLATKVFIGNLPAMGRGWVIIK